MLFAIIKIYISIEKYVLSKKPTLISKLIYTLHKNTQGGRTGTGGSTTERAKLCKFAQEVGFTEEHEFLITKLELSTTVFWYEYRITDGNRGSNDITTCITCTGTNSDNCSFVDFPDTFLWEKDSAFCCGFWDQALDEDAVKEGDHLSESCHFDWFGVVLDAWSQKPQQKAES